MKTFLSILSLAACCLSQVNSSQPINMVYRDYVIDSCYYGKQRFTPWFNMTDFEGCVVMVLFDQPSVAGFRSDSVAAEITLQHGDYCVNLSGGDDTAASPYGQILDTINTTVSSNFKTYSGFATIDSVMPGALDTVYVSGSIVWKRPLYNVLLSNYGRIGVRFIAGSAGTYAKRATMKVCICKRKNIRTEYNSGYWQDEKR